MVFQSNDPLISQGGDGNSDREAPGPGTGGQGQWWPEGKQPGGSGARCSQLMSKGQGEVPR